MGITNIENRYNTARDILLNQIIAEMESKNFFLRHGVEKEAERESDIVNLLIWMCERMFNITITYDLKDAMYVKCYVKNGITKEVTEYIVI